MSARAADWFPLGPYGGDVRALTGDPLNSRHIFLGTATGWIYESQDGGGSWVRVARLTRSEDLVISRILVDPANAKRLMVGAFRFDRPDGGVFVSEDGGKSWYLQAQMRGQSVRSMSRSASDPTQLVAGTLQGVFRSKDNGTHWSQISPAGSTELHEVESIAIDPTDPNVIYAGTWHLPWKTTDGGATWTNIKQGIIDDSDVFSIIIDPTHPQTVYASACSGIYKSLNAGEQFKKIQGIPSTARRTRKLLQDPTAPDTVFAGTTEGLYRTRNGGDNFVRTTGGEVIINDVYVDSAHPGHVLLATDRGGVLSSEDGGDTFQPSNTGFSARQVLAFAADAHNAGTIYVGVVNDKDAGGVFQSLDGGVEWTQQSIGLAGRDVFSLTSTAAGTLLAGTGHGVYRLAAGAWTDSSAFEGAAAGPAGDAVPAPAKTLTTPQSRPVPAARRPAGRSPAPPSGRSKPAVRRKLAHPSRWEARDESHDGYPSLHRVAEVLPKRHASAPPRRVSVPKGRATDSKRSAPPPQHARAVRIPPVAKPPVAAPPPPRMDAVVYGLLPLGDSVYAATSAGLMRSGDDGNHWGSVESLTMPEVRFVAGQKNMVLAGSLRRLALSVDNGSKWDNLALPEDLTQLSAMAVDELGNLWVGGAEGVFYSTDYGLTWKTLRNLFTTQVDGIFFDAANHRVLVTTANLTITFAAHLPDYKVSFWDTGWHLRFVRPVGDHLIGATFYDGMVLQPRMVAPDAEKAGEAASSASKPAPAQR